MTVISVFPSSRSLISWSDLLTPPHAEPGLGPWAGVTALSRVAGEMAVIAGANDTVFPRALQSIVLSVSPAFLRGLG